MPKNALVFRCDVLFLRIAERPDLDFIALNALAADVADRGVLVLKTGCANVFEQFGDGVDRAANKPRGSAHAVAFDEEADDLCALFDGKDVHDNPLSIWFSLILTNNLLTSNSIFVIMLSLPN